jgi:hypothetical protein
MVTEHVREPCGLRALFSAMHVTVGRVAVGRVQFVRTPQVSMSTAVPTTDDPEYEVVVIVAVPVAPVFPVPVASDIPPVP